MKLKLAIIGAGSVGFTRNSIRDLLSVPELQNADISLMDINETNLDMVYRLIKKDIRENAVGATVSKTTNRVEAVKDADFVYCFIRVGGLEAFESDIDIPLKYGVDQCVGDTLCAGGIMYGQRTINVILDLCEDIKKHAKKKCILISHTNPNAMVTWAANEYGGVPTIGLCHGVQHGASQIENALNIPKGELDYICAGINHQTWYISLKHKGVDVSGGLLEAMKNHKEYSQQEKVRIDMLERFGYYSTESNGHLSEYVQWYRKRAEEIEKWISTDLWINGETGGYLRVCREGRNWFEHDFENWLNEPAYKYNIEERGVEHTSRIVESLVTGRMYRGHFNVINKGYITNLPYGCCVEVPGYVDGNGINIPVVGELPDGCAAVCSQSVWVQKLAVKAAVTGNIELLRQAFMMDPLVGAVCNPPEIWQMVDEMLIAQEVWLPQYKEAIKESKLRMGSGNLIPTKEGYKGAVRLAEKNIEDMDPAKMRRDVNETDKAADIH